MTYILLLRVHPIDSYCCLGPSLQVIHDDPKQTDEVAVGIRGLNKLAKKLRAKRMEAGALLLASAEVCHRRHSHQKLKAAQMRAGWVFHAPLSKTRV